METARQILTRYWGYTSFRPLQEEIIRSVLDQKDTLALLPTGGGKSVCFQVPAMMSDGICIVISPLIALMKDQVENLRKKGIKALAIVSGMNRHEVDVAFDNCTFGNYKFLYLSPERLSGDYTRMRIERMNVNLIAVDEAHCISHWGYDFRPPYLEIARIRELHPDVPVLALTATATTEVITDIQQKLGFKQENVFRRSFERKNLSYIVLYHEDKIAKMLDVIHKVNGSAIVYVRSRKATKETAQLLQQNGITADFYHAGLTANERNQKQQRWLNGEVRIIVATNAFGMGIDKPDVRLVIHLDMPDSIEAYFQEAGRAGRDGKQSYAILFFGEEEIKTAEKRYRLSFPPPDTVKNIYHAIGNYLHVPLHTGKGVSYDFDLNEFAAQYQVDPLVAYHSIKVLEMDGYLSLSESVNLPSRILFTVNNEQLYRFQIQHPTLDYLIKVMLRSYTGLFDEFVKINEKEIAKRANTDVATVINNLEFLERSGIVEYSKQTDKPQLTFIAERHDKGELRISKESLQNRQERYLKRQQSIIQYASTLFRCRSVMLLQYFGEKITSRCGTCDYCRSRNKLGVSDEQFDLISEKVISLVKLKPQPVNALLRELQIANEDNALAVIQWMVDNHQIEYSEDNRNELRISE